MTKKIQITGLICYVEKWWAEIHDFFPPPTKDDVFGFMLQEIGELDDIIIRWKGPEHYRRSNRRYSKNEAMAFYHEASDAMAMIITGLWLFQPDCRSHFITITGKESSGYMKMWREGKKHVWTLSAARYVAAAYHNYLVHGDIECENLTRAALSILTVLDLMLPKKYNRQPIALLYYFFQRKRNKFGRTKSTKEMSSV